MVEQTGSVNPQKKKRTRSPAYPFINLETAIARAKEFYDKEQRNSANVAVAVKDWGFADGSSNGAQTIAALSSFGLFQDEGIGEKRTVRLTPNALKILLDTRPDSTERADLIKVAALTPKIHQQLWWKWKDNLPSDAQLRHTLLLGWETPFNENAVDGFIAEYKDTISFAKLSASDSAPSTANDEGSPSGLPVEELPMEAPLILPGGSVRSPNQKHVLRQDIFSMPEGIATIQWPTPLSAESIQDLKDWLAIVDRKISRSIVPSEGSGQS